MPEIPRVKLQLEKEQLGPSVATVLQSAEYSTARAARGEKQHHDPILNKVTSRIQKG